MSMTDVSVIVIVPELMRQFNVRNNLVVSIDTHPGSIVFM